MASTLASKKSYIFDIFIPEPVSTESYWNKPMVGIKKAFEEIKQYSVNINVNLFNQFDPESFRNKAEQILNNKPEGVVLAPFFSKQSREFIAELEKHEIPYVFIDSDLKGSNKLCYIGQNSFQSGKLAAKLLDFTVPENSTIAIIHFAKQLDNLNHLLQRERGFYEYFDTKKYGKKRNLVTLEVTDPNDEDSMQKLLNMVQNKDNPGGIFVTNSQVYYLSRYLEKLLVSGIRVVGYDLINENIEFLNKGHIDFLICQRPEEQGHRAITALFDYLVLKKEVEKERFSAIDIITKENLNYYK